MTFSAVNIAATAGILGSTWITGGIMNMSTLAIPALLAATLPPQAVATQWNFLFERGKATMPPTAVASLLGYAYLAYDAHARGQGWKGYAAAGLLTVSIVPFTLIVLDPTNRALTAVANGSIKLLGEEGTKVLLQKWARINFFRSLLTLSGSLIGFWSLLG
ncbi:DUF1772-domain-containing protein [Thozetella sp. PMI_491]|nr:DUF1772-domain-containing protein [Thozetella sp. PMI_491]